jgi:hypothetical protein
MQTDRATKALLALIAIGLLFAITGTSSGHHSFAVHFDPSGQARIQGAIADIRIRSPHSFFAVDVQASDGSIVRWQVETHSAPLLKRVNIDANTFVIGQSLTISGMPSRVAGRPLIFGLVFETSDGRVYEWAPDRLVPEGLATGALESGLERFEGVWGYEADPNPHINAESPYPLTQAGLDARATFDPLDTPAMQCIPPNLPSLLYLPYLYGIEIEDDEVRLHHEYFSIVRTVPLNGQAAQAEPSGLFGRARGRVDGDAIVVDSEGFPDLLAGLASDFDPNGVGADVPSSSQKEFTERYTLSDDGQTLFVDYTVVDPVYLTESFNGQTQWQRLTDGTPIEPFECDPEIAAQSTSQGR